MKLKTYISAFVSPTNGEIHIVASSYPSQSKEYFDILETYFDVPEAAIAASDAIKATFDDTGDIEKKISDLQAMLDARKAK